MSLIIIDLIIPVSPTGDSRGAALPVTIAIHGQCRHHHTADRVNPRINTVIAERDVISVLADLNFELSPPLPGRYSKRKCSFFFFLHKLIFTHL